MDLLAVWSMGSPKSQPGMLSTDPGLVHLRGLFPRRLATQVGRAGMQILVRMALATFLAISPTAVCAQPVPLVESITNLIRKQSYEEALKQTDSGLKRTPRDVRLWTLQGLIRSHLLDYAGALKAYQKALSIVPDYRAALKGEAELVYSHSTVEAIPVLKRIVKVDPTDSVAYEMLAIAEAKQGDCESAIDHFKSAGQSIDEHSDSLSAYGYCLAREQSPEASIPVLERLIAVLPNESYPKFNLALVNFKCRKYDEALKILEPLLSTKPGDAETFSLASEIYEAKGDTPHAVPLLRQAIILEPLNPDHYIRFAGLCLDHDSIKVGIEIVDMGIQRFPKNSRLYIARGILNAQLADLDKAEADFRSAEMFDAGTSLVRYAADTLEIQKGNGSLSLDSVREQIKSNPESPQLRFILAQLLMNEIANDQGQYVDEAKAAAKTAIDLKPDFLAARDLLANIYLMTGKYDLAAAQCREVLKYNPISKNATFHLLIALRREGIENHREEIQTLTRRLQDLQTEEMRYEKERKLYRIATVNPSPN